MNKKEKPTPKAPQNRMTRNQKRKFKQGVFRGVPFHERPEWARVS